MPQGSVLGPTLWNLLYDDVLRLQLGEHVRLIAYAGDIVMIIDANHTEEINHLITMAADAVGRWMEENELQLAPEKTELVILKGHCNKKKQIVAEIMGNQIQPSKTLKYLGVVIGQGTTFGQHISYVSGKAEKTIAALMGITRNIGGPSSQTRTLLYGVVQSIILYVSPVWAD